MGIHCEVRKCTGCGVCAVACMDEKDIQPPLLRKIVRKERMEGGELQLTFNSQSCFHCVTTRCATVCPTGSILRDTETGIVIHDNAPCIGCGKCREAKRCVFDDDPVNEAIEKARACDGFIFGSPVYYASPNFFNTDHIIQKCDGCIDRVRQGLLPVCVEACPQQALEWEPGTK